MKVTSTIQTVRKFILTQEEALALKTFIGGTSQAERAKVCSNDLSEEQNQLLSRMYHDIADGFRS